MKMTKLRVSKSDKPHEKGEKSRVDFPLFCKRLITGTLPRPLTL